MTSSNVVQVPFMAKSKNPPRPFYKEVRSREHLYESEVEKLIKAAKTTMHPVRNQTLILMMYLHGLRAGEAVNLKWDQINYDLGTIHIVRNKGGMPSTHPIRAREMRLLRKLQKMTSGPYVFVRYDNNPITIRNAYYIVQNCGQIAELPFPVHPHMLRHACGYYLASNGQDTRAIQCYLGHAQINNTVKYTALAPGRFNNFFPD